MNDPQRVRELFDELADLSPADQLHRLEQIREQDMRLASDLWRLLEIDRDDARSITQASKIGIALTLREAETQALLNTKVDRFTLVEEIGRGGVGVVFKAGGFKHEVQHRNPLDGHWRLRRMLAAV